MKVLWLALLLSVAPSLGEAAEELPPPPPPPPGADEPPPAELAPRTQPLLPHGSPTPSAPALPPPPRPPPSAVGDRVTPAPVVESQPEPARSGARRRFDDQPWVLSAELGLASLVGLGGLLAGYNVHDRLEFDAGLGSAAGGDPAFAINAHGRPLLWYSPRREQLQSLTLDVGFSFSRYETVNLGVQGKAAFAENSDGPTYHLALAHWFQYAFGWEMLTQHGYDLRAAFGVAIPTNTSEVYCTNSEGKTPCPSRITPLPSLSFSVGHVF